MTVAAAGAVATARVEAVCLNEFMASNGTCLADGKGQYEDWIELYNPGPSPVDVGGMFLTDDPAEPAGWQIPSDRPDQTIIPPGGFIPIWADNDVNDTGLHASFKLSSDGEELALIDGDGLAVLDRVVFGRQVSDVSCSRWPDGGPAWALMTVPSTTAWIRSFCFRSSCSVVRR